jgi:predicted N-acyltransferase
LARGYQPVPTYSAHYIPNPGFRRAVEDYLESERQMVAANIDALDEMGPYRKGEQGG